MWSLDSRDSNISPSWGANRSESLYNTKFTNSQDEISWEPPETIKKLEIFSYISYLYNQQKSVYEELSHRCKAQQANKTLLKVNKISSEHLLIGFLNDKGQVRKDVVAAWNNFEQMIEDRENSVSIVIEKKENTEISKAKKKSAYRREVDQEKEAVSSKDKTTGTNEEISGEIPEGGIFALELEY